MKKFIVTQNSNITLNNNRYLLESGDEIMVGPFEDENKQSVDYWLSRMAKVKEPTERKELVIEITNAGMRDEVVAALKKMQAEFGEQGETQ